MGFQQILIASGARRRILRNVIHLCGVALVMACVSSQAQPTNDPEGFVKLPVELLEFPATTGNLTGRLSGSSLLGVGPVSGNITTSKSSPDWLHHWETETVFIPGGVCPDAPHGRFVTIVRDSNEYIANHTYNTYLSVYYTNTEALGRAQARGTLGQMTSITNSLAPRGIDPSLAWAAGGQIYLAAMGRARNPGNWGGARIMRSDDCGVTWVDDSLVPGKLTALFKDGAPEACDRAAFENALGCSNTQEGYSKIFGCWCDVTPDMLQLFIDPYDNSQWAIADFRTDANYAWRDPNNAGRTAAYTYRTCIADCTISPVYGPWNTEGAFIDGPGPDGDDEGHYRYIWGRLTVSVPRGEDRGAASGGALVIVGLVGAEIKLYLTLDKGETVFPITVSDPGYDYNFGQGSAPLFGGKPVGIGAALGDLDLQGNPTVMVAWKSYANPDDRSDLRSALVLRRVHINMSDPNAVTFKLDPQIVRKPAADENQILYVDLIGSDPRYTPPGALFKHAMLVNFIRTVPDPADLVNTKFRWKYILLNGTEADNKATEKRAPLADWMPNGFLGEYYNGTSFVGAHDSPQEPALRFLAVQPWSNNAHYPDRWDNSGRTSLKYLHVRGPSPVDPCTKLDGYRLVINGNGYEGTTEPYGGLWLKRERDGTYVFETKIRMNGEPVDKMVGKCKDRHIEFTRTREGVFEQHYDGWIFENDGSKMAGTISHNGVRKWGWYGSIQPRLPR